TQVIGPTGSLQVTQTSVGTKSARIDIAVPQTTAPGSSYAVLVSDPERRFSQAVTVQIVATSQKLNGESIPRYTVAGDGGIEGDVHDLRGGASLHITRRSEQRPGGSGGT